MGIELGADLALSEACVMLDNIYLGGVGTGRDTSSENPYKSQPIKGMILVNGRGNRFVQEDADWGYLSTMQYLENAKMGSGSTRNDVWAIVDSNVVPETAVNFQWMAEEEGGDQWVKTANSIEELAETTELPARNLIKTVQEWNEYSEEGVDPDRKTDFGPIATPPFYAVKMVQNPLGACGGLRTDIETRVLNTAGEPIERLFAAGQIASGMFTGPFYPGCGWAVLGTVHWGRKAGRNAAALDARA